MKIAVVVVIALLLTVGTAIACHQPEVSPSPIVENPIPSDVVVTLEPTITEEVVSSPSATQAPTPFQNGTISSDGLNDGLGCASHDCSAGVVVPNLPPNTGHGE